uniref:Uncharacterized protein n=1 Tax=Anguilla anguilla TaxID=7936 RepID=A0A0E9VR45_ANGAN
MQPSSHTGAR